MLNKLKNNEIDLTALNSKIQQVNANLSDLAIHKINKSFEQTALHGDTSKKSVVSEHALRVNNITGEVPALFSTIGQQVNKKSKLISVKFYIYVS